MTSTTDHMVSLTSMTTSSSSSCSSSSSPSSSWVVTGDNFVKDSSTKAAKGVPISKLEKANSTKTRISSADDKNANEDDNNNKVGVKNLHQTPVWIGGPESKLPGWIESMLAWALALSCLSVACWYYYVIGTTKQKRKNRKGNSKTKNEWDPLYNSMPLMTHCPRELMSVSTVDGLIHRYGQLQSLIHREQVVAGALDDKCQPLITFLRTHEAARRLTSLIMLQRYRRQSLWQEFFTTVQTQHDRSHTTGEFLLSWLESAWSKIVALPQEEERGLEVYRYQLSVIIPLYKENGMDFVARFSRLVESADNVKVVEFLIINAGGCTHITDAKELLKAYCSKNEVSLTILEFIDGGGRGPCLNYGTRHASGRILTFLHADTQLPMHWDTSIRNGLSNECSPTVTTLCAFSFGIDKKPILPCNNNKDWYDPPGLNAIETTANLRCRLFQLPYGDQCLSVPRYIFDFVGGYPDQCLMEDYELVQMLRQRCRISSKHSAGIAVVEKFNILPQQCYCSPRRWQSFGVLYVTYTNSRIVQLYNSAVKNDSQDKAKTEKNKTESVPDDAVASRMSPDEELFCRYYGMTHPPPRKHPKHSPWEVQLVEDFQKKAKS